MQYKLLGRSGLRVSEFALGTMTFGENWGWGASKDASRQIFDAFAAAGGNFIDTANRYTEGTSEQFVGEFTQADRGHFVVATKYTLFTRRDDPNASGNQRKNMVQSLEASLKRLRTEYVDLFYVHAWDFLTPVEEVMRGLDDLVRAGKVLYVGISDTPAWVVSQANTLADLRGWSRFVSLQTRYSLIDRAAERDLLPMARSLGLAVTPWSILGSGVLTGKYRAGTQVEGRAANWERRERDHMLADEVAAVAEEAGATPSQVAINWVRQSEEARGGTIIPLIGARTVEQFKDNLASLEKPLTASQLARLDEASQIELGFPHDFLASNEVRSLVFGGTYNSIQHR
jgi:aryl-alcohol dehydrogenase-like predicted oxidoreductase